MEFKDFEKIFCEILPIIYKAAPAIGSLIGSPATGMIIGLLAVISESNACDHHEIARSLKNDQDLYAKLQKLEQTHAEWLNTLK